ncbi:MAG: SH3 domain-containing protein [Rhodospirillales bacterium]|nr:SH3 domain-containing protein [Rhodospirillales bacterium]
MILRKNVAALAILSGLALFALSALAPPAMACGDLQGWIEKYQSPEATDASRQTALRKLAGPCDGYVAVTSDELLLDVLHDALRRPYDKALVQAVFARYRCIPGVAEEEGYGVLTKALDTTACPTGSDRQNWFVVASGGLLRAGPSKSSRRVGWVKRGIVVEKLAESGEWLKVRTWQNKTGFIHESLLAIY